MPVAVRAPDVRKGHLLITVPVHTDAAEAELGIGIELLAVHLALLHDDLRCGLQCSIVRHGILCQIDVNQQREKARTPPLELSVQVHVARKDVRLPDLLVARIDELALEWDETHTTPRTPVHRIDRRQGITHHEEFPRNLEALLVGIQTPRLHGILTAELLHAARVERLTVIRLLHVDEPLVLDTHDIRIGRTRLGTLPRQGRRLKRRLVVSERHHHEVD